MANRKHEEQLETTTVFCGHCGSWTRHTTGQQPQCLEPSHTPTHTHATARVDDVDGEVAYRSEPPEGYSVREGTGGWWRESQYGGERWYTFRAEAVAACWSAYKAQQAKPEPSLEAQLAEAEKASNATYSEWLHNVDGRGARVYHAAYEVLRIKAAIAARDEKAET
jgi:hypothetical protein